MPPSIATTDGSPIANTEVVRYRFPVDSQDASLLRDEINRSLLSLLAAGLIICLLTNVLFGTTDFLFESEHHIWIGVLRFALIFATLWIWVQARKPEAYRRAVTLSLATVALACIQTVAPRAMHGDLGTPILLSLAMVAALSTAAPWGVAGQVAAIVVVSLETVVTLTLVSGDLRVVLDIYPTTAAAVVFGMSLYGASVCRRSAALSIERGIALRRTARGLQEREEAVAQLNATLERRVRKRTEQLEAANTRLEEEIAERRLAAEALRRSQEQLRDILDNTTAVIYLKDTSGRYQLINIQYEKLFHVSREEVVGKTDYDLFPKAHAEAFRRNDSLVQEAGRSMVFEEIAPHDDGDHTYISVKFPLCDEQNAPYAVCGISTDITPRKEMEAQLRVSQAQLSALIENTGDAIWSIDRSYRMVVINSVAADWFAETYGKPLQMQDQIEQRAPAEESALWRPLYDKALAGERIVFERNYPKRGEMHSYLISVTPIATDHQVSGATVFAKDITDLKRAEERVREHQAALSHVLRLHTIGEMAAGLAHEINQPLAAIANYARGCRNRIISGDVSLQDLLPVLEQIAGQALRGGEIIRRLRSMVEKKEPTREVADLNAVVAEAVHVVESQIRQQSVTLNLEPASGLPPVAMDPIQIEQVVVNLLLNSLEAMQAGNGGARQVTVSTQRHPDGVEIVVKDSGSGLAPEVMERAFEPFFTSKESGLGMGLTISRSIVEGHGGRIQVANNSGGGAQVHVVLPSAKPGG
ncbi:MAG: PAS domain-containing protein [Deltaproteobacteria bacterium]|nr:PAS domain-containing protein [Deltaproteobacteria bacterium]